jgi:hypothetical protein
MAPSLRGGAYTYDWIENPLGLDMHSADRVLPEYQHPQVGDTLGYGKNRMRFERVEPQRVLATRSEDGNWVWTFVLDEQDGRTRFISRNRFRLQTLTAKVDGSDGAGLARDGTEDAPRDQATCRTPRHRREGGDTCLRSARALRRTRFARSARRSESIGPNRPST